MTILDIVLLIIIAGFTFYGLFFGLIRTVGSLLGVVVGAWLASMFYLEVFAWVKSMAFGYDALGKVLTFFILFTLINRLVSFGFIMLDRTFDFFSVIPFLKTINRLGGAVFGFVEGGMILGLFFYLVVSFPVLNSLVNKHSGSSQFIPYLKQFVQVLKPVLPGVLETLKKLV